MRENLIILASLCLPALSLAQNIPADSKSTAATIAVDTKLVNLPVVVRDKKGALVQNLTKADFTLQVDGKPQTIRYFDKDTDLPLTLGLLVDTSQSQRSVLDDERSASSAFIDTMLTSEPGRSAQDKAFILQFAKSAELLQDVTSSLPKLQAAIKEIGDPIASQSIDDDDTPVSNSGSGGNNGSGGGRNNGGGRGNSPRRYSGGTTLYDSLFLASDELMSKQTGRKALIILSDGNDRGSRESLAKSLEAAQRAETIVYAIYFKGQEQRDDFNDSNRSPRNGGMGRYPGGGYPGGGYPGGGYPPSGGGRTSSTSGDGKKVLDRIARETGGRLFEVSKKQTTAQIYTEIAEELRAQYRLGYTPDQAGASDGYHKVDLALTTSHDKNLIVQTRDGYYTGK